MSTKEKIVQTVIEMLRQNVKYEEISMTMVAEKVGIGKSTIYDYFKTKSELLIVAVYQYMNLISHELFDFDINNYNFHDALIKQLQCFLNNNITPDFALAFITDNKTLFTNEINKVEHYLLNLQNKITKRFEDIIKKGIEEQIIYINNNQNIVYVLNSIIFGAIAVQCRLNKSDKKVDIFESIYEAIVKLLN